MTILSPNGKQTMYDIRTNTLTRILDNHAHKINLNKISPLSVADVARMTSLDNENFSLMAYVQLSVRTETNSTPNQEKLDKAYRIASGHYLTRSFTSKELARVHIAHYIAPMYKDLDLNDIHQAIIELTNDIYQALK